MTQKQREALDFICKFIGSKGYSPSVAEIASALGNSSKSGVIRLIRALQEQGEITFRPNRARSIELNTDPMSGLKGVRWIVEHYDNGTFSAEQAIESIRARLNLSDSPS